MEHTFFVQNLKVILRNLLSEDKDDYFALYQQNSIFKKKKKKEFRDFLKLNGKKNLEMTDCIFPFWKKTREIMLEIFLYMSR